MRGRRSQHIGAGETAATVWHLLRLPLAALFSTTGFAWMYYSAPTIADPHWKWISAGAAVAVAVWVAAPLVLFFFASSFGSYNATYGAFASANRLAVWLWLTNVALLLGAEINAAGRYADERAQHEATQPAGPSERPSG